MSTEAIPEEKPAAPQPPLGEMMAQCAAEAVRYAKEKFHVELDYSEASIEEVEKILDRLCKARPKGFFNKLMNRGPSRHSISNLAKIMGGYLGEVLRRAHGGEWSIDEEIQPGMKTICLRNGKGRIFPPGKVYKRIMNGEADNVWRYYQSIVTDHWKKPG